MWAKIKCRCLISIVVSLRKYSNSNQATTFKKKTLSRCNAKTKYQPLIVNVCRKSSLELCQLVGWFGFFGFTVASCSCHGFFYIFLVLSVDCVWINVPKYTETLYLPCEYSKPQWIHMVNYWNFTFIFTMFVCICIENVNVFVQVVECFLTQTSKNKIEFVIYFGYTQNWYNLNICRGGLLIMSRS